ncbi:adipogenesis regulatory factor-like [Sylvia atricapilla]|uniref:adipogenesis regulatory factor-like n=1 Tax=Sylvia atricapilla TaxID=48155 RepID=UPI0033909BD8
MTFPCSSLHLPSNYWEESCFVYKKLHFAKQCNRTELRDSPIASWERRLSTAMFGIGKKLAEEAAQQAGNAAQVAVDTVNQTVQQAAEQAKSAGQKALDEVYKVAETGEKAVKNVANQATSWGKSFGQ